MMTKQNKIALWTIIVSVILIVVAKGIFGLEYRDFLLGVALYFGLRSEVERYVE